MRVEQVDQAGRPRKSGARGGAAGLGVSGIHCASMRVVLRSSIIGFERKSRENRREEIGGARNQGIPEEYFTAGSAVNTNASGCNSP